MERDPVKTVDLTTCVTELPAAPAPDTAPSPSMTYETYDEIELLRAIGALYFWRDLARRNDLPDVRSHALWRADKARMRVVSLLTPHK